MIHTALTDSRWLHVLPVLHPPAPERQTLNGILHFLTTGCSWAVLPIREIKSSISLVRSIWLIDPDGSLALAGGIYIRRSRIRYSGRGSPSAV